MTEIRRIYVIAGNYREFIHWCQDNQMKRNDRRVFYIQDITHMRGFHIEESKGDKVVLYGTFESRMDWPLMVDQLAVVWRP